MVQPKSDQDLLDFSRIENAIDFIRTHFKDNPSLDEIAEAVHLSPFHFQRLFSEWAGISPKKFLQYTKLNYLKSLLQTPGLSLFEAADHAGYSSCSRVHEAFILLEGMSPADFAKGAENLKIHYQIYLTPFGNLFIAASEKGICKMEFIHQNEDALILLKQTMPNAIFIESPHEFHTQALSIFNSESGDLTHIKLHLKGTPFQLKVWQALLSIPVGQLESYSHLAERIHHKGAARAVGSAIGNNPIAFLIPCHRVIQASGQLGGYKWGLNRKLAMIAWEQANQQQDGK